MIAYNNRTTATPQVLAEIQKTVRGLVLSFILPWVASGEYTSLKITLATNVDSICITAIIEKTAPTK